jgi:hypothetical protein
MNGELWDGRRDHYWDIGIFDPLSQEVGGVNTIPQLRVYGIALTSLAGTG